MEELQLAASDDLDDDGGGLGIGELGGADDDFDRVGKGGRSERDAKGRKAGLSSERGRGGSSDGDGVEVGSPVSSSSLSSLMDVQFEIDL